MKKLFVSACIIAFTVAACKTGEKSTVTAVTPVAPKLDCTGKAFTYAADIKPIMDQYCTRCHNENQKAGYNFLELASVKKAASNGALLGTIKHSKGFPSMPAYGDKLSDDVIAKIECWMNSGMQ